MALDRDQILARLEADGDDRDLSGLDLSGADLSRLDLRGVNLSRADLSSADLRWAILEGADLNSSVLRRADARWAVLRGASLRQADLTRANLGWADITGADLTGAEMTGTNLENVDLGDGIVERRVPTREWAIGGIPAELHLPRFGPAVAVAAAIAGFIVVHLLGWLYNRAYFGEFELLDKPGVVSLGAFANFSAGISKVVVITLQALLLSPLVLIGLGAIVGLLAAITYGMVVAGERALERVDVRQPQVRPLVLVGIFVVYTALFWLVLPPATAWATEQWDKGLPTEGGFVRAIFDLISVSGWLTKLGAGLVLAAACALIWFGWRWLSIRLSTYELPAEWRLRYPALGSAVSSARSSALFARSEPFTDQERRYAIYSAALGLLLLATLLTGVGRVYALYDMCDGGDLPRVQLYTNRLPENPPDDSKICQRQVAETADEHHVFFPSETVQEGGLATRRADCSSVAKEHVVMVYEGTGAEHDCRDCNEGPRGTERVLVDPDEAQVTGVIMDRSANLLMLDKTPEEPYGTVSITPGETRVILADGRPADDDSVLVPDLEISAVGYGSADKTMLDARQVRILPRGVGEEGEEGEPGPAPVLIADLTDLSAMMFTGTGWTPGHAIEIGPGEIGSVRPGWPIITPTADQSGTFSAPVSYQPAFPTGPNLELIAYDPVSEETATAPWITEAPPTPTLVPTRARPTSPPETTPRPISTPEPGDATATALSRGTNTPFPTSEERLPPPGGAVDCDQDQFEPDWPRGFEKEIYVSFSESAVTLSHNFCGTGGDRGKDVDLSYFFVKRGRWYRVFTTNLAPGVDTVMAVGDLSNSTPCDPAGCWNDDRGALTYESEIVFQAVDDDRALITVDNRGSNYATDATYELGVIEFVPTPTPSPSPAPSATTTATPTPTETPLPLTDRCEPNDTCRQSNNTCLLAPGMERLATLYSGKDEDWYMTVMLEPGDYVLSLLPPVGQDYDLELRRIERLSTSDCPLVDPFIDQGWTPGDAEETISWRQLDPEELVVRVFTPYSTVYGDPHHWYRIRLDKVADITLTPTPTSSASSTVTRTPSVTITPSATFTATRTATVTATDSVTATATATATPTSGGSISPPGPGTPSATASPQPSPAATATVTASSTTAPASPTVTPTAAPAAASTTASRRRQ